MGNNLDHSQIEVRDDLHVWGEWIVNEVGLSGFRLDAVKHMSQSFLKEWIQHLDEKFQRRLFFVGEYWRGDLEVLGPVIEKFNGRLHLFDVALAGNMSKMSHDPVAADLRNVFDGTLTKHYPGQAVVSQTFTQSHLIGALYVNVLCIICIFDFVDVVPLTQTPLGEYASSHQGRRHG